ncbi:MAG: CHAD domain-containing protein [Janthinobacterium lividum]
MALKKESKNGTGVHPVKTLQDHIESLDAAMLVATTAAEVGAVHKLRTSTRRVEAHLRLVDLLEHATKPKAIPEHATEAKAVQRRLRRVRRAAGAVRDLDVQADAIWYDAPAKTAANDDAIAAVRKQAKALRKHLNHMRGTEAAKLIDVLHAQQQKLAAALQALEQAMKPASVPAVEPAKMAKYIERWFANEAQSLLQPGHKQAKGEASWQSRLQVLDEDGLHNLRKVAKLCRYMAESAPDDLHTRQLAEQFEAVQETGGNWHDWLLLVQLSKGFHGKKAELTQRYTQHSEQALAKYRQTLLSLLPSLTATADL